MNGILIDPSTKGITEISLPEDQERRYEIINKMIGCAHNDVVGEFQNGDVLCGGQIGKKNVANLAFTVKWPAIVLFGKIIVLGFDSMNKVERNPITSIKTLSKRIDFLSRRETEKIRTGISRGNFSDQFKFFQRL